MPGIRAVQWLFYQDRQADVLFRARKSQPEVAARADHSHTSPYTRSWVAFNARQRAFSPASWDNLLKVPNGEALQPRADRWPEIMRLRSHPDNPPQSKECGVDHDGELAPVVPRLKALSTHIKSKSGPR
ncbi:hypothetical protein ASPFODRAFT_54253, partial [Aspergillus luchuensis CBS 106.47]